MRSTFWKHEEVKSLKIDPYHLQVVKVGDKGAIASNAKQSLLSGWMPLKKAHEALNEYIQEFSAHHSPISEV